jgi:hypothetical protein
MLMEVVNNDLIDSPSTIIKTNGRELKKFWKAFCCAEKRGAAQSLTHSPPLYFSAGRERTKAQVFLDVYMNEAESNFYMMTD